MRQLILGLILVVAQSGAAALGISLDKASYENEIIPLLESKCATCHEAPGASFDAVTKIVVPGNLEKSKLYRTAKGLDSHPASLESAELSRLERWISGAASAPVAAVSHPGGAAAKAKDDAGSSRPNQWLAGRVDLTAEFQNGTLSDGALKNSHYLIFLRAKASSKTSFFGEIANGQTYFFGVDYKPVDLMSVQFGKILVPFGDTSRFHLFYGGVRARMFNNIWTSPGLSVKWNPIGSEKLETYVIQGLASSGGDPDLQNNGADTAAVGFRWTSSVVPKVKLIASGLYEKWQPGVPPMYVVGGDIGTEYGLVDLAVLRNIRLGFGNAVALVSGAASGTFKKYGDYLQLYTNLIPLGELRFRYGTYRDNWSAKSAADTQGFNVTWFVPVDVIRFAIEYEWNFEAVTESQNDVLRLMASVDF